MKKISEFLSTLNAWTIYDNEILSKRFKEETGFDAGWTIFTSEDTLREMKNRGLGGTFDYEKTKDKKVAYGFVVAQCLANEYVSK